jgi:glycosyltransferase involved in cell wall biosynthesis
MPQKKDLTFCYFGIYKKPMARDSVLLKGLRENGVTLVECVDASPGLSKFRGLTKKHKQLSYDVLFVGYLSNIVVPLAALLSKKKVVYNALCSMYEGEILDRRSHSRWSLFALRVWFIDFLAFHTASLILVESEAQKSFLSKVFFVSPHKLHVLMTGADDSIFYPDATVKKRGVFTAVFRGWFLPATGVEYVLEAAKMLKKENINVLLIGRGMLEGVVKDTIKREQLTNVELITEFVSDTFLREKMLSCHVVLGQFSDHPRLDRTIQNKTFEALALSMPYVTRESMSNREILTDKENCLLIPPADSEALAQSIMELKHDTALAARIAEEGYSVYRKKLTPKILATKLLDLIFWLAIFHMPDALG